MIAVTRRPARPPTRIPAPPSPTPSPEAQVKLKRILLILLLAGIGLLIGSVTLIDAFAKKGIEAGGTYCLGVPTTLDSANIGIVSGMFGLQGLTVANPEGYESPVVFPGPAGAFWPAP